jgi:WD40 repeat protein
MKFSTACPLVLSIGISACSIQRDDSKAASAASPTVIKSGGFIGVVALQFSPKGDELARVCAFRPVALFDTARYGKARTFLPELEHTPELSSLAYSPDGAMIATARGWDGALIWDAHDLGKARDSKERAFFHVDELYALETPLRVLEVPAVRHDVGERVDWIGFSPDGRLVLTAHGDGRLRIRNTQSWTDVSEFVAAPERVTAIAFAPDGKTIAVADQKGTLHEWNIERKTEIHKTTTVHPVYRLEFSHDGSILVGSPGAGDGSVTVWKTSNWESQTMDGYSCATLSHGGELLALGGRGHIKLIQAGSRKEIRKINLPKVSKGELFPGAKQPDANEKVPGLASALTFSPDDRMLAVGEFTGNIDLFDVASHH